MSVSIVVQVPAPAGERWKTTESMPDPPSDAVALSGTSPRRLAPGSVRLAAGAVLSTRRPATVEVVWLPAASLTSTRRS